MVLDINVLEVKSLSIDCACYIIESIIMSGIFVYGTECNIELVLCLIVLMLDSDVGS